MKSKTARVARVVAPLIMMLGLVGPARGQDGGDDDEVDTGTPLAFQLCNEWCWATTVEMVAAQLGHSAPQCQVVSLRYGPPGTCCGPDACYTTCNTGSGGPDILTNALSYWGVHGSYEARALTAKELRDALKGGAPVIAATFPHAFVISGYRKVGGKYSYTVLDPLYGRESRSYADLLNYRGYSWAFSWYGIHD